MAPRTVRNDLDAVQRQLDVWRVWRKELFASLRRQTSVQRRDREDAEGHLHLARNLLDFTWQVVLLELTEARGRGVGVPWGEPAHLPVVPIVGQEHLRPDAIDLPAISPHAAVIWHVPMHDWHADVAQDPLRMASAQKLGEAVPSVLESVVLEKVVLAAIACDLQLRSRAKTATLRLRFCDGHLDPLKVPPEVHGPLVQIASRNLDKTWPIGVHPLRGL
mmetsp:Transcript_86554/g.242414  ORF Transcript_86554/g.242414 Transcript_86554/m.242414 type:complete len:219 (-) Transcript_86554:99-755(-)